MTKKALDNPFFYELVESLGVNLRRHSGMVSTTRFQVLQHFTEMLPAPKLRKEVYHTNVVSIARAVNNV